MMGLGRSYGLALGIAALALAAAPAGAQDNREQGKSPAQLFASDCSICHKSAQGLSKGGGLFGLQGFLREHYTTSRETAAAIAAYLDAVDRETPAAQRRATTTTKRPPKGDAKKPEAAPAQAKAPEDKPSEPKASDTKPAEPKPEAKPAESKPAEAKPAEPAKSE